MNKAFSVLALVALAAFACGYVIEGDCVVYENAYGRLSQCPHTLTGFTNYVEINATSYFNATQDLDFALGFDTAVAKPKQAWYWKQSVAHQVPVYCNVSYSRVCYSSNFSYTLNPKIAYCYNDTGGNSSLMWAHSFENGWPANKTIEWFEWARACKETKYWPDWSPLSSFSTARHARKTWYIVTASFEPNETKRLRARIGVQPNTAGKYDVVIKRHSDTWTKAFTSGRVVSLDPWWNVSWFYRKPLSVSEGNGTERLMEAFTVNVTGLSLLTDNCTKEIRITADYSGGETEIDRMIVNDSGQAEGDGDEWCEIMFLVNLTAAKNASYVEKNVTNYYFYYGNAGATDPSYSNLAAWNLSYHGDVDPLNEGWVLHNDECSSNYSYVNSGNLVWNANDTDGVARCRLERTDQTLSSVFTVEARYRAISETGGEVYASFGGVLHDVMNPAYIEVNTTAVGVGRSGEIVGNLGEYNYLEADATDFHVYRLLTDNATHSYWLYMDGALVVSGTNASATSINTRVAMGQAVSGGAESWNGEIDFFAFHPNGLYPPLSATLGAQESNLTPPFVFFTNCSDEQTGAALTFSASLANATNATSSSGVSNVSFNASVLSGLLTINANATGFYDRRYFATFNGSSNVTVLCFLLNSSASSLFVRFHVRNVYGVPVSSATVNILRIVGGSLVVVGQQITDAAGDAAFYMEQAATYYVQVVHPDYDLFYSSVAPTLNDYTIVLIVSGEAGGLPTSVFDDVFWYLDPPINTIANRTFLNISLVVVSTNSSLAAWGMNVSWNGTVLFSQNVTSQPSGGILYYALNASNATNYTYANNITVSYWFIRNPSFFGNRTLFFRFFGAKYASLEEARKEFTEESGLAALSIGIVIFLVALIVGGWVARRNPTGGLISIMLVLGIGAYGGWLDVPSWGAWGGSVSGWLLLALGFSVAFALIYLRERI